MARKRTKGAFYKNGRRKQATTAAGRLQAWDYGNTVAADRIEHYNAMAYQGGGHGSIASDGIGLLWLVGALDNVHPNLSGKELFDAVRLYAELLAEEFPFLAGSIGSYEPRSRTSGDAWENFKRRNLFQRMDGAMTPSQRRVIRELVDSSPEWFEHRGLSIPYWAMTHVHAFQIDKGLTVPTEVVRTPDDYDKRALELAVSGMCALFDENLPSRRAA